MSKEIEPHILEIYHPTSYLGSGAYGHVWKATHLPSGRDFALKKIFDAFQNDIDAQRTYREITILPQLQHDNIIKLHEVIRARNGRDIYLVFQFMETDLHSVLGEKILQETHIRFIAYQLCKVMKFLHSAQVIHRDMKSSNILINSSCEVKVCDFGLVRSLIHEEDSQLVLSEDVATRWYRSPEMLLGAQNYGKPTDMWSIGCIIAELVRGEPIFPGSSTLHQLEKIMEFTGTPNADCLDSIESPVAASVISQIKVKKRSLKSYLGDCDEDIKDMILRMLEFDPALRITAEQALELPCLQQFRGKSREAVCNKFITTDLDDNKRLTLQEYRRRIYCDIERKYPSSNTTAFMPRITRPYRSLQSKSLHQHQGYRKIASNSLIKLEKNNFVDEEKSLLKDCKSHKSYKKTHKFASHHKENHDSVEHSTFHQTASEVGNKETSKVFKRRLKANLWAKNQ